VVRHSYLVRLKIVSFLVVGQNPIVATSGIFVTGYNNPIITSTTGWEKLAGFLQNFIIYPYLPRGGLELYYSHLGHLRHVLQHPDYNLHDRLREVNKATKK
jgi:hypothetical protein